MIKNRRAFLIGIKGSGVSSLASFLYYEGYEIFGSDVSDRLFTQEELESIEVKYYGFGEYEFQTDDLVIVGVSFNDDHLDVKNAKAKNCEMYYYDDYLGILSKKYRSVAVTGTHGKTTTTSFVRSVMETDKKINSLVACGQGYFASEDSFYAFEACEYKDHFHKYYPTYAIVTNVDYDHVEYFKTREQYRQSFIDFSKNVQDNLIVCGEHEQTYELFKSNKQVLFYGFKQEFFTNAQGLVFAEEGCSFELVIDENSYGRIFLEIFGEHNVLNFLAAITIAYLEKENIVEILQKLDLQVSARRRFDEYFYNDLIVVDDYAHHYHEIKALLSAVKQKYQHKQVIVIYQPLSAFRLKHGKDAYFEALNMADRQIICDVYIPKREEGMYDYVPNAEVLLEGLTNGEMFQEKVFDELLTFKDTVIVFSGITIYTNYTAKFLEKLKNIVFD